MKKLFPILIIALLFIFVSCEKNEIKVPEIQTASFSVKEYSPLGDSVGYVQLSGIDDNLEYIYEIVSGNTDEAFGIDNLTGTIRVNNPDMVDFEVNPIFTLEVKVSVVGHFNGFRTGIITINVTDVKLAPTITSTSFSIPENSIKGRKVGTISLSGIIDNNLQFAYSIISGNTSNAFSFNPATQTIYVNNADVIDYETTPNYNLVIRITVVGYTNEYSDNPIAISVTDVPVADEDLMFYYKFNGNGKDETGNSDATVVNGNYSTDLSFSSDMVLSLDGTGYADTNSSFDYENRTVSLWFKATSITSDLTNVFVCNYENNLYGSTTIGLQQVSGVNKAQLCLSAYSYYPEILTNTWYNVAIVQSDMSRYFYLNGSLVDSGVLSDYANSDTGYANAVIGANRYFDRKMYGYLSNVRLYERALSADEIKNIYDNKL